MFICSRPMVERRHLTSHYSLYPPGVLTKVNLLWPCAWQNAQVGSGKIGGSVVPVGPGTYEEIIQQRGDLRQMPDLAARKVHSMGTISANGSRELRHGGPHTERRRQRGGLRDVHPRRFNWRLGCWNASGHHPSSGFMSPLLSVERRSHCPLARKVLGDCRSGKHLCRIEPLHRAKSAPLIHINSILLTAGIGQTRITSMIRALAMRAIIFTAALSVVTAGWACGLTLADPARSNPHSTASADDSSAMPDNPMQDCQGNGPAKSQVAPPCFALCAVTVTVTPTISRAIAVQIGEPHYPAAPSIRSWLIQPELHPPRA